MVASFVGLKPGLRSKTKVLQQLAAASRVFHAYNWTQMLYKRWTMVSSQACNNYNSDRVAQTTLPALEILARMYEEKNEGRDSF